MTQPSKLDTLLDCVAAVGVFMILLKTIVVVLSYDLEEQL